MEENGFMTGPIQKTGSISTTISAFLSRVYLWMTIGLGVTFGVAFYITNQFVSNPSLIATLVNTLPIIFIGEILLVIAISAGYRRFSIEVSAILFLIYSLANGLFFGLILGLYELDTVVIAFAGTMITFLIMSLYGYFAKQDLTKFGNIAIMTLVGIIVMSILNIFMRSEALYWIVSYVGLAVFVVLVAYDTQKLKAIATEAEMHGESSAKYAIRGALSLYLDFINIFLYILRILGGNRR